jgi:hypothetical protein
LRLDITSARPRYDRCIKGRRSSALHERKQGRNEVAEKKDWQGDDRNSWLLRRSIIGNKTVEDYIARKDRRGHIVTRQDRLWELLYSPSSSNVGMAFAGFISLLTVVSFFLTAARSRQQAGDDTTALLATELTIGAVFTLELLLRLVAAPTKKFLLLDGLRCGSTRSA